MKPTLERSDQVVARVVAWHNRHPLALRITPDQVHSVGVVSLPYAVRGAILQGPDASALPVEVAAASTSAEPPLDRIGTAPASENVPAAAETDDAATEVAIEAVVEFEPDGPTAGGPGAESVDEAVAGSVAESAPPAPPASDAAAPAGAPAASILDRALVAELAPSEAAVAVAVAKGPDLAEPAAATPAALGLSNRPSVLPARPRPWHPLTWWGWLRGRLPFHSLFSEDFIRPLRPRRVAAWVARHGAGSRPLEPLAPQRLIVLDASRRRAGDDATELNLHVITAAIGLGDERHRLLLAADGRVLGRRQWSRPRLAAAAGSACAVIALVGGGWMWRGGAMGGTTMASHAVPAALAASGSASASASAAMSLALQASAPVALASASAPASAPVALVAEPAASAPRSVNPRRGRIDLSPLVPRLADGDRHELRTSSRELRREPAVLPDAKAWALVTSRLSDKRQSERVAAQLHAIALLQPVPMRAELMPVGSGWRAVFWPFPTAKDAEKVRLALADKGLQTEIIEF